MAKILVIDDMPDVRLTIDVTLDMLGHEIVEAENGQVGIELLEKENFDLVITDIHMPVVDGTEVLKYIAAMDDPPPVVVISGGGTSVCAKKVSEDLILSMVDQYACCMLRKPFTGNELKDAVAGIL